MHHKKTHGKFNSLKQISFNELYTCPICLCVAHLVSFKSNIFIISTNLLLINSPYWKFIWRSMSMFEHQSLLDSFKWINFIHVLDHASIHSSKLMNDIHPDEDYYRWTHSSMFKSMLQAWALGSCISNPPWKRKAIHYMSHLGKKEGKWHVNKKCNHMENKGTCFEWKCITIVK